MESTIEKHTDERMVTSSILLNVDGKIIKLEYSVLKGYLNMVPQVDDVKIIKKEEKTEFEKCFLWPIECFLPQVKGTGPQIMYRQIVESNYNQPGVWHELRWSEVK